MNNQKASYTFDPNFSIEANSLYLANIDEYRDYKIGINALVKRWLAEHSQANIYASAQAGYFHQRDDSDGSVLHGMLMADWESRHLYTAAAAMLLYFEDEYYPQYKYRFGFAPFVAGMDTLQAWLIFELSYFEKNNNQLEITPMMRFFYKNVLWEMGSSLKGELFLTLMVHY